MVAISFSTLDKVGHDYGPDSHEVQDVLLRLDRTLGGFFSQLDRVVGAQNYVVALSADHGVSPLAERLLAHGIDAGRIAASSLAQAVNATLVKAWGRGPYVSGIQNGNIYLDPGVFERLIKQPAQVEAVRRSLQDIPGVQDVFTRDRLVRGAPEADEVSRRLARSYDAERSGDVFVTTRPYWSIRENGTGHGSQYGYDPHVPIILMGTGIAPGEYVGAASPLDIAPTLAFLAGVTLPHVEGRVLSEALAHNAAGASGERRRVHGRCGCRLACLPCGRRSATLIPATGRACHAISDVACVAGRVNASSKAADTH